MHKEASKMSLSEVVKSINAAASSIGNVSEEDRQEALAACNRLRNSLENPFERVFRLSFSALEAIATRLGVDMKLFDTAVDACKNGGNVRIEDLASEANADPLLVTRIMRLLAGVGLFKEVGKGLYTSTDLTSAFVSESAPSAALIHTTMIMRSVSNLPAYFEEKGYKNPDDSYNGPFQFATATKQHVFDYLASNPRLQNAFSETMKLSSKLRGLQWFEYFPVETKLRVESSSDPLLVDIGGSLGHDLAAFKKKYPNIPGKLVLQDLPVVVNEVKDLPPGIEVMAYDIFDPQPVKGAKAYYLRSVLHDFPDKQSRQILSNIRDAMTPESCLLICETVQPETGVTVDSAQIDIIMMTHFAALERTQQQFETLLDEVGFELVRVWRAPPLSVSGKLWEQAALIEAVLKKQ